MASHLTNIKDEDLLRKMWQETEDFGRKKEIRAHMYKLREARLKEFYVNEMDSKAPITTRHGNSMADHSFESLKSNEIRGTDSPMRDIKFGPITGNTGGWNVISSSEMSDDGKARTEKMSATTEGVTAVDGGKKAFSGKNEELKTERFDGDANNFTYSTGESSNMSLNENIVTGDGGNKRIEKRSSSVSHSSNVVRSSANTGDSMIHDGDFQQQSRDHDFKNTSMNNENSSIRSEHHNSSTNRSEHQNSSMNTSENRNTTENRSENVKLSQEPSVVQEAFRLSQQPGNILSRHVERANPTTNMITEKKQLVDGTIVTTKRYETINSDHVDIQATTRDNRSSSNTNTSSSNVKTHDIKSHDVNRTSQNTEQTIKTSRDDEAFKLSQQDGNVLSRNVEMTDPTTRMITEKKQLADGTVVTTRRYENVSLEKDHSSNVQRGTTKSVNNDNKTSSNTSENIRQTSTNETFRTARDEEAFRLAQQPGKVLSRDVTMANPTTRMITEKKELTDGTIVTTKRYESIDSDTQSNKSFTKDQSSDTFAKNLRSDSTTSNTQEVKKTTQNVNQTSQNVNQTTENVNQTFKTARDEEAFRLAQQPGKVLSRDVTMTNPTTCMITEKKELTDGTIVTTKRYESIDSDTQSNKSFTKDHSSDTFAKNLRSDSTTSNTQEVKKTTQNVNQTSQNVNQTTENVNQTFKTARDEEAFRLAQQPGNILSRDVTLTNPTTRMITEKKELTDGTIVTTRRYETINNKNETVSKVSNRDNVETQNIKKTVTNSNTDAKKSTYDNSTNDRNVQREVVEETITKKLYDTSCACPENHDAKKHTTHFIHQERDDKPYDVTSEIITNVDERVQNKKYDFTENERNREEIFRREEVRKLEQKRVDEQVRREQQEQVTRKFTRELEVDSAHKAFASSLRCVTPPNERVSTPSSSRNDNRSQRSPSRETTTSKISSSTATLKKSSNTDVRKNEKTDRRPSTKSASPEKQPKKVSPDSCRSTTEIIETVEIDTTTKNRSVSPQKITQSSPRTVSPSKTATSPQKSQPSDKNGPKQPTHESPSHPSTPRDGSPQKPSQKFDSPRDVSPNKSRPSDSTPQSSQRVNPVTKPTSRDTSPQKPGQKNDSPRDSSPQKYPSSQNPSRDASPQKPGQKNDSPRESTPNKSYPGSRTSTPRETTPHKSTPTSGSSTPREASPQKYPSSKTPSRDTSPNKSSTVTTKTTKRDDTNDEIYSSTIVVDNKDKRFKDDLKIVHTIDTKNLSATTSVSDLEYIVPDRSLITDLDSEDNIEIKLHLQNLRDTDDLQIKTTIREIDDDRRKPGDRRPADKKPDGYKPDGQKPDSKKPDDKKPCDKKPFNRSETFEERARKLIGVPSDDENNEHDDGDEPHYAKPTFASLPNGSRVSEIRERKAKIEKETQEIESVSINKKKTITNETEDFISREKAESRRPHSSYSSPDQSPTRNSSKPNGKKLFDSALPDRSPTRDSSKPGNKKLFDSASPDHSPTRSSTKPTNKKPSETQKPHERSNENGEVIKTNVTKMIKTTETRQSSLEKKKPIPVEINRTTTQKVTTDESTRRRNTSDTETIKSKTTLRSKSPETHITVAKINISPVRVAISKSSLKPTVVETSKTTKVAPSIRLVKRPMTDVSSTEPDSDVETETDQDLIRNIDKGTSKATRKKLIQSRKDSAPVTKTTVTSDKLKVSRSVSESLFKSDVTTKKKTTSKDVVQSRDSTPKKDSKRPTKCVTTKTINLKNVNNTISSNTLDDVVIDVKLAKSSREPSPNKTVPIPVRPDEDTNGHQMIYPDKVTEPEDYKKPKSKVTNIPIFEEQTRQFVGLEITEVETNQSQIILEEDETDEHEVINSSTLERADRKRNSIQIDPIDSDDEVDDDHSHLLSVSQKVNKFISTAEELKKPRTSTPFKGDDPRLEDVSEPEDDSMLSVNRKVTKFSTISDETSTHDKKSRQTINDTMTSSFDEVDEQLRNDECLLSVSDKVSKFITSAEKLVSSTPQKSPELVKNIMKGSSKPLRVHQKSDDVNESFLTKEKISTLTRDDRSDSKSTLKSATSDITLKSTEAIKRARAVFETNTATRDIKRHDDIMSRPSVWEGKRTPTAERKVMKEPVPIRTSKVQEKSPSRERQSASKERQTPSKDRQSPYKDYCSPSPSPSSTRRGSSDRTPAYMRDQVSNKKDLFEKRISSSKLESEMSHQKSLSPQTSVEEKYRSGSEEIHHHSSTRKTSSDKHYMSHTVASLEHVNNERRDTEITRTSRRDSGSRRDSETRSPTKFHRNISESTNDSAAFEAPRTPTKFGVELKRTDSGKNVQTRRVSTGGESINVEEIFDLVELEKLLEIVVGYEQRRLIRAQIRIVKKNMSERTTSVDTKTSRSDRYTSNTTNYSSPARKPRDEPSTQSKVTPSYATPTRKPSYRDETTTQSKSSSNYTSTTRKQYDEPSTQTKVSPNHTSQTRKSRDEPVSQTKVTRTVVEKPEKFTRDDSRVQRVVTTTTTTRKQSSSDKPEVVQTKTTRTVSDNKSSPRAIIETLNKNSGKGKTTENVVKIVKKSSATSNTQKSSSTRESRTDTDCVTSSYGVGPTDSNGLPLFGLRALKKKGPTTTTESKTTGSVTTEVSHSSNGRPATVERKTMHYSTDPSDFKNEIDSDYKTSTSERKSSRGGVYSVTKIEKFQDDGKSTVRSTSSPSSKVIRRGSVKELKDKFVRKDSSSKVTESSSKTETKRSSVDYRDSESESESYSVSRQYKSSSNESKSFLNSEKKASNVQEVLSYMRNADHVQEDGDSKDDAEARALLNKFLGATALMTGIESNSGLSKEFLSTGTGGGGASSKNQRGSSASSKVTKTVSSYSAAKSYDINDVWDVDLLKKILESTTNYDDRRRIRSRLREVMADKEACAEIVKQLTAELDAESAADGTSVKKEEGTMTKTSSEVQQQGDKIIKTTTTEVITKSSTMQPQQKMSPFAKFRQLDRQNSLPNSPSPKTPSTPTTPGGSKMNGPMFTFTDPALQKKASSVTQTLLYWCQIKTKEYENIKIDNFSTSWSDGLAFAALIHHFLPDAFDYSKLTPKERRHNFTLAFQIAEDKAGIAPLLDVDDMVMYKKPDWKCVFCYVQSIYRRFKNED